MANPFDASNPFAADAAAPPAPAEYNPFEVRHAANYGAYDQGPVSEQKQPLLQHEHGADDEVWGKPDAQNLSIREQQLMQREQALRAKEAELKKREEALIGREADAYNWPFKCWAITYHSIADEIPFEHQTIVSRLYFICLFTWLCLFYNWLIILILWWTPDVDGSDTEALWASIYLALGIPLSWKLWYRSIYYGLRDNSSKRWVFFFVNMMAHLCFTVLMSIGIPNLAAAGLWKMLNLFAKSHSAQGIMVLICFFMWLFNCIASFIFSRSAYLVWRGQGGDKQLKRDAAKAAIEHGAAAPI